MLFGRKAHQSDAHEGPVHTPVEGVNRVGQLLAISRRPDGSAARSVIGATLSVRGNLLSVGRLQIDGRVNGDIRCAHLTVGRDAIIVGNVTANEIVIGGTIKGTIRANGIVLQGSARVKSDIFYKALIIEQGVDFEGVARHRDDPMTLSAAEIVAASVEAGGDPVALRHLVRPLLSLSDNDQCDPAAWAKELSLATAQHDAEVLIAAAASMVTRSDWRPTVPEIAEECERIDREIGGQTTMSAAMYRMYAFGVQEWKAEWGPRPGEAGCRLLRGEQDRCWREVMRVARNRLLEQGWADAPDEVLGLKTIEVLEQNSGVALDKGGQDAIPRRIRVEFDIPTRAKATKAARAMLAAREELNASRQQGQAEGRSQEWEQQVAAG